MAPSTAPVIQGSAIAAGTIAKLNASTTIKIQGRPEASKAVSKAKTSKPTPSLPAKPSQSTATRVAAKCHHPLPPQSRRHNIHPEEEAIAAEPYAAKPKAEEEAITMEMEPIAVKYIAAEAIVVAAEATTAEAIAMAS